MTPDVEALKSSGRRRGSCLDAFLVASVCVLFLAVAAVAVGGTLLLAEMRSRVDSARPSFHVREFDAAADASSQVYKMQNFAHLEATSSKLKNSTMTWAPVTFGAGKSVGSQFVFDSDQHSLRPIREGTYFMYIQVNLSCTYTCNAGLLSVRLGDMLTCEVELQADATHASRKCWTVNWMDDEKQLLAHMTVSEGLRNWKLELVGSNLGMFLVD